MSLYYPDEKHGDHLYYVEFNRHGEGTFTLFKRQFLYPKNEYEKLVKERQVFFSNEIHPYNMFSAEYGPNGSVPDEKWVKWMVDTLNEKVKNLKPE